MLKLLVDTAGVEGQKHTGGLPVERPEVRLGHRVCIDLAGTFAAVAARPRGHRRRYRETADKKFFDDLVPLGHHPRARLSCHCPHSCRRSMYFANRQHIGPVNRRPKAAMARRGSCIQGNSRAPCPYGVRDDEPDRGG